MTRRRITGRNALILSPGEWVFPWTEPVMADRAYHQTFVQFETLCGHLEFLGGEAMGVRSQDKLNLKVDQRDFHTTVVLEDGTCYGKQVLTGWEIADHYLHPAPKKEPGAIRMYFQRRRRVCQLPARWFQELRGLRDVGDRERYGIKSNDDGSAQRVPVEVFLGWPAYLASVARPVGTCLHCGREMPTGRDYCGATQCSRERARIRKREERSRH